MPRKFAVGDKARIAPERLARYYSGQRRVRVGRIVTITAIRPTPYPHGKCSYLIGGHRNGLGAVWMRSDDLRPVDAPKLAGGSRPGSGRKCK